MVVDKVITHNTDNKDVLDEHLMFNRREEPIVLQLGGSDPVTLAKATQIVYQYGYEEVNLNAGCPSCKVAGLGEFGAALIKKPNVISSCLEAMAAAAPIKVSLKTRLGVDDLDSKEYFSSMLDTVLSANLSSTSDFSMVVHARKAWLKGLSPAQNRSVPPLDYQRAFDVCGSKADLKKWYLNGGINTLGEAADLLSKGPSNMEGVMLGRAAMNTPCIFANTDVLLYGEDENPPTAQTRRNLLDSYCEYIHDKYSIPIDSVVTTGQVFQATKPLLGVFHGHKGNRHWRSALDKLSRSEDIRREYGIAGIIEQCIKDIDWEILDAKLV
jgi:tRNA-dihydrouridine synthase A